MINARQFPGSASPRRRRWGLRLAALTILTTVGLYFAPVVAARTPLRSWILMQVLEGSIHGTVHVGSASFGWLEGPEFHDVTLFDEAGVPLLQTPHIRFSKLLLPLALNHSDLGTIVIQDPTISVVCTGAGSNLEQVLAPLFVDSGTGPSGSALSIQVVNARATITDRDSGNEWAFQSPEATIAVPAEASQPIHVEVKASFANGQPGSLNASVEIVQSPALSVAGELQTEQLPLGILTPLLRRIDPKARSAGSASANLRIRWQDGDRDTQALIVDGKLAARNFELRANSLGNDRLELAKLELPCKIAVEGRRLRIDDLRLAADIGNASMSGQLELNADPLSWLEQPGFAVAADIDLARLAGMLPHVLHLQQDTKVTSGRITLGARSMSQAEGVVWTGRLQVRDIRAVHQGQSLTWDTPLVADVAVRHKAGGLPQFDKLQCVSEFLSLDASGTPERLTATAQVDLGRLSQRLSRFVDLGEIRPAGTGILRLAVQRDAGGSFQCSGTGQLNDLVLALPGRQVVREREVQCRFEASGGVTAEARSLKSAGLFLSSGNEGLDLQLQAPLADLRRLTDAQLGVAIHGQLARWQAWLTPLATLPDGMRLGGVVNAAARVRYSPQAVELSDLQASVRDARLHGLGLNITEPSLTLQPTTLRWQRTNNVVEMLPARLVCQGAALQVDQLALNLGGAEITGKVVGTVRGDLGRILAWVPTAPGDFVTAGVDGPVAIELRNGQAALSADVTLTSLTVGPRSRPTWTEPTARVAIRGSYDWNRDGVQFDELRIATAALGLAAAGQLERLNSTCDLVLSGQLSYDLQQWQGQLRRYLGPEATISGRDQRPFRIEGSLAAAAGKPATVSVGANDLGAVGRLRGEAGAGWQSLNAFGFQVGSAELKATMFGDGWLRVQPVEANINNGKLRLEPYLRLAPEPMELVLGKSTRLERARINPAVCARSLGYAAPVFAGVREAEGEVSLVIDGGRIPLADPTKADIWGKFTLHSARATPGPLVRELSILMNKPPVLTLPREVSSPVRLVNGRVYHENLEMPLGEITVRSSGSVGLDGSLALMLETPIPPKWLGKAAPPGGGKTILKVPIGGTLAQPRLDERALQQALGQQLRDSADKAIKRELEKELQKLFRPPGK